MERGRGRRRKRSFQRDFLLTFHASATWRGNRFLRNLLAVIFEAELRRIGLPLVRSPNPALHLMLHPVERVDLDQRFMLSAFDAAVQARQAAVHGIAENIRDRLARPGPPGLRAVSVPVELLADLGDA